MRVFRHLRHAHQIQSTFISFTGWFSDTCGTHTRSRALSSLLRAECLCWKSRSLFHFFSPSFPHPPKPVSRPLESASGEKEKAQVHLTRNGKFETRGERERQRKESHTSPHRACCWQGLRRCACWPDYPSAPHTTHTRAPTQPPAFSTGRV